MQLKRLFAEDDYWTTIKALQNIVGRRNRFELHQCPPGTVICTGATGERTVNGLMELVVTFEQYTPRVLLMASKPIGNLDDLLCPRESFDDLCLASFEIVAESVTR